MSSSSRSVSPARFTSAQVILWPLLTLLLLWVGHHVLQAVNRAYPFDCPRYWPFSVFDPRVPRVVDCIVALLVFGMGFWGWQAVARRGFSTRSVAALGLLLVLGTNAVQGVPKGFGYPVMGGPKSREQYYQDLWRVESAPGFLRNFNQTQPDLRMHARTHPPGAVLLFYGLQKATGDRPPLMGICIAFFSTLLTVDAMRRLLRNVLNAETDFAGYGTLLLLALPAVQVYYCASVDAVIAALLLWAIAVYAEPPTPRRTAIVFGAFGLATFLTFGSAWAVPVFFFLDVHRRSWPRFMVLMVALVVGYALLYYLTGYNEWAALRTASRLENPDGFRPLVEPRDWALTRLENVSEIAAFFGPFLLVLLCRGLSALRRENSFAFALIAVAVGTLLGLFLIGAYHTGETARACLFVWSYLLLPVLAVLRHVSETERRTVFLLVLAQTLGMQLVGTWFW